jgi:hypothetical protein
MTGGKWTENYLKGSHRGVYVSIYYPGIYLEELKKTTKNLSQDSRISNLLGVTYFISGSNQRTSLTQTSGYKYFTEEETSADPRDRAVWSVLTLTSRILGSRIPLPIGLGYMSASFFVFVSFVQVGALWWADPPSKESHKISQNFHTFRRKFWIGISQRV